MRPCNDPIFIANLTAELASACRLLDGGNVTYWLARGTLLGAV